MDILYVYMNEFIVLLYVISIRPTKSYIAPMEMAEAISFETNNFLIAIISCSLLIAV